MQCQYDTCDATDGDDERDASAVSESLKVALLLLGQPGGHGGAGNSRGDAILVCSLRPGYIMIQKAGDDDCCCGDGGIVVLGFGGKEGKTGVGSSSRFGVCTGGKARCSICGSCVCFGFPPSHQNPVRKWVDKLPATGILAPNLFSCHRI
jgi:hypothetical protein